MKRHLCFFIGASVLCMLAVPECADNHHYVLQGPPRPPYVETPPIVQLADASGFRTGAADGARDGETGRQYRARTTPAYRDTLGYDGHPGPFPVYRNTLRETRLRGV